MREKTRKEKEYGSTQYIMRGIYRTTMILCTPIVFPIWAAIDMAFGKKYTFKDYINEILLRKKRK